jgi:hypothetical protein
LTTFSAGRAERPGDVKTKFTQAFLEVTFGSSYALLKAST